jgi:hypothetical protein
MNRNQDLAQQVAEKIGYKYYKETWFSSIAVEYSEKLGHYVEVRVSQNNHPTLPSTFEGIPILVTHREKVTSLGKTLE